MGCGNATGIGYIFNFEANYSRNSSAKTPNNHFHWIYTYDSLSLMDYTSGALRQTKSSQTGVAITPGAATAPVATYVGVATSVIGVASGAERSTTRRNISSVRFLNRKIRIEVPGIGDAVLSFINMQGRQCASVICSGKSAWIDIPNNLPEGMYIVALKRRDGAEWSQRTVLR